MPTKSCEKASGSVLPCISPRRRAAEAAAVAQPYIDLNPAPNWEKAFRDADSEPEDFAADALDLPAGKVAGPDEVHRTRWVNAALRTASTV